MLHGLEVTCAEVVLEWLRQGRSRADGVASFEAAVRPGGPKKRRPGMNLWRPCDASWCPSVPPSQSDILFEHGSRAEDVWHNYCYGRARSVLNGLEVTCAEVVLEWLREGRSRADGVAAVEAAARPGVMKKRRWCATKTDEHMARFVPEAPEEPRTFSKGFRGSSMHASPPRPKRGCSNWRSSEPLSQRAEEPRTHASPPWRKRASANW